MKTNREIEQKAEEVLGRYLKRGNAHRVLNKIIDGEGIKYKEIVVNDSPDFCGAFTTANSGQLYIFINGTLNPLGRKNFTVAHELGHYFLEHNRIPEYPSVCSTGVSEMNEGTDFIEREANYFATCLLMPSEKIKKVFINYGRYSNRYSFGNHLTVTLTNYNAWCSVETKLTQMFGVSKEALKYRLKSLGLVTFRFER